MNSEEPGVPIEILLVEDNPGDIRLTREVLKDAKLCNNMSVATNGEEALAILRQQGEHESAPRPGLVLLDLNLPGMSGREVLAEAKSDPELRRIPVVVLTTSRAEQDILESYDLHANAFISKPVDLDSFIAVVRGIQEFWLSVVKLPPHQQ